MSGWDYYKLTSFSSTQPSDTQHTPGAVFEALEPRLLLSGSPTVQVTIDPASAIGFENTTTLLEADTTYQQQTQYDNFFFPNVVTFDFTVETDAFNGIIDMTVLSDLNGPRETVAYDIEGVVSGILFTEEDDGVRPFTATIELTDADLAIIAADGNLHIEFTPSSRVDDFAGVQEYVTVGLTYQQPVGGSISGSVWADVDKDGVRTENEPGMPGVTVFLDEDSDNALDWNDLDNDNEWDAGEGERWVTTSEDREATALINEAGSYQFSGLEAGEYHVVIQPAQTFDLTTQTDFTWNGTPLRTQTLSAPEVYPAIGFGWDVAQAGGRLLVGADLPPEAGYLGGAYVYHETTDGYDLEAVLRVPENAGVDTLLPKHVALNDEWAAIAGWIKVDEAEVPAITLFHRVGSTWTWHSVVTPTGINDVSSYIDFNVALSNDAMVVSSLRSQQAWVFELQGNAWTQVIELTPDGLESDYEYGRTIAFDGQTIAINAPYENDVSYLEGSLYIYERVDGVWTQTAKFAHRVGWQNVYTNLAVSGDLIVSGGSSGSSQYYDGYDYVYRKTDQGWQFEQKLISVDSVNGNNLGRSVAIVGDAIASLSPYKDETERTTGAVYIFEHNGTEWVQTRYLTEPDLVKGDGTVSQLHAFDDTLVIAAYGHDTLMGGDGGLFFYTPGSKPVRSTVTLGDKEHVVLDDVGLTQHALGLDLLPESDTGYDDSDRVTAMNNQDSASRLGFRLHGLNPGVEVTLYRNDGVVIGSGIATGYSLDLFTDGSTQLAEGLQYIEARLTLPDGQTWLTGQWIDVVIDTHAPIVTFHPQSTVGLKPTIKGDVDQTDTQVWVTVDGHTIEASVDETGYWTIAAGEVPALAVGTYDVQVHAVDAAGNETDALYENALTATAPAQISGVVWQDVNGDGEQNGEDKGLAGIAVYLDLNVDGLWSPGEPRQLTTADNPETPEDEAGRYTFTDLPEGDYFVRLDVLNTDYRITSPGSAQSQWASLRYEDTFVCPYYSSYDQFGYSLDSSEHVLVVGKFANPGTAGTGEDVTIYTREDYNSPWEFSTYLNAKVMGVSGSNLGVTVATNDRFVFIGAYNDQSGPFPYIGMGAFYIYERDDADGGWVQRLKVEGYEDGLWGVGNSLAVSDDTLVVGTLANTADKNGVYVYHRDTANPAGWTRSAILKGKATGIDKTRFGSDVAISGDIMVVNDPWETQSGIGSGSVYVYRRDGADPTQWNLIQKILPPISNISGFGNRLEVIGNTIVASDNGKNVYLFEPNATNPDQWELVAVPDLTGLSTLRDIVVGENMIALVGSPNSLILSRTPNGDNPWDVVQTAPEQFSSVIDGEHLITGTPYAGNSDQGAVEFYRFSGDNPWHYLQAAPGQIVSGNDFGIELPAPITGDLNADGQVGIDDLDIVLNNWNQSVTPGNWAVGDPTGDGFVGLDDLDVVLNNWNDGESPAALAGSQDETLAAATSESQMIETQAQAYSQPIQPVSQSQTIQSRQQQQQMTASLMQQATALAILHSPTRSAFTDRGFSPVIGLWETDDDPA